ncbi:MAG: GTP pyrophosphokinase [Anaerolineae bacterium]
MGHGPAPSLVDIALQIAAEAHAGQTDKAGAPYILHPLRMMLAVEGEMERVAALLHDVIEDGGYTLEHLARLGIPQRVLQAVDALTRRAGESYEAFVQRAAADPIARTVKIADLQDNMDIRRLPALGAEEVERLQRYRRAWEVLTHGR